LLDPRLRAQPDAPNVLREALQEVERDHGQSRAGAEQELAAWLQPILADTLAGTDRASEPEANNAEFSLRPDLHLSSVLPEEEAAYERLSAEEVARRNEELLRLARALARLPEDQRTVLKLKHLQGYSVADICRRTGKSKVAVVGLLFEGTRALGALLVTPDEGA
jgi:RNA polymerase sigma-70 factor (ECF subfamily)